MSDGHLLWYVARASGLAAYALLFANVVLGLRVRTRSLGRVGAGWGAMDLHRVSAVGALAALALHLVALALDGYMPFGPAELFVPLVSEYRPVPTALGILSLYLLLAVAGTSALRSRIPLATWRAVHTLSYAAYALALFHGLRAGTDAALPWVSYGYWITGSVVGALYFARLFDTVATRSRRPAPAVPA